MREKSKVKRIRKLSDLELGDVVRFKFNEGEDDVVYSGVGYQFYFLRRVEDKFIDLVAVPAVNLRDGIIRPLAYIQPAYCVTSCRKLRAPVNAAINARYYAFDKILKRAGR